MKKYWMNISPEEKTKHAMDMAKAKWSSYSEEEKSIHIKKMTEASIKSRKEKKEAFLKDNEDTNYV